MSPLLSRRQFSCSCDRTVPRQCPRKDGSRENRTLTTRQRGGRLRPRSTSRLTRVARLPCLERLQVKLFGRCCVRVEFPPHEGESSLVILSVCGSRAILGNHEKQIAHVGVSGREKHADIGRQSCDDHGFRLEVFQQCLESCRKKRRVLRLEHEVIGFLRLQQLGYRLT